MGLMTLTKIKLPSGPPMHPAPRRCSLLTYSRYARSSRLAGQAPRHPEGGNFILISVPKSHSQRAGGWRRGHEYGSKRSVSRGDVAREEAPFGAVTFSSGHAGTYIASMSISPSLRLFKTPATRLPGRNRRLITGVDGSVIFDGARSPCPSRALIVLSLL